MLIMRVADHTAAAFWALRLPRVGLVVAPVSAGNAWDQPHLVSKGFNCHSGTQGDSKMCCDKVDRGVAHCCNWGHLKLCWCVHASHLRLGSLLTLHKFSACAVAVQCTRIMKPMQVYKGTRGALSRPCTSPANYIRALTSCGIISFSTLTQCREPLLTGPRTASTTWWRLLI